MTESATIRKPALREMFPAIQAQQISRGMRFLSHGAWLSLAIVVAALSVVLYGHSLRSSHWNLPAALAMASGQRPPSQLHAAQPSFVPPHYHLTFDDEFDTLSISDEDNTPARWHTHTVECCMYDTSSPATPTHMAGISAPDGQRPFELIAGQGLAIRLQKTKGAWYSGLLATVDRQGRGFAQQYGYFEMKAKFPSSPGTWPAFWLLNSAALTSRANAGEIDIVESYMFAPQYVNTTLHDWTPPAATVAHKLSKVANLSDGFHIFGMLWTESTMSFFCDGELMYSLPTPPMMHQPYYPIIDLGLGGGWPTKDTPQASELIVRYMRVYAADPPHSLAQK